MKFNRGIKTLNHLLLCILFSILIMGFQCERDMFVVKPLYEFSEKLSLSPYKKTYVVGDTIWIQFQTADKSLFDKLTGSKISTDTTFLHTSFSIRLLYSTSVLATKMFDTKVEPAIDVQHESGQQFHNVHFKTDCSINRYSFRVGFVLKQKGIFSIQPYCILSACPSKQNVYYSTFKFLFDLSDCNKDIWLSIPPVSRGGELGSTDVKIDRKELFVFKVD